MYRKGLSLLKYHIWNLENLQWVSLFKSRFLSVMIAVNFCLLLLLSCSVMYNSLKSHGLQHTRLPCSSPFPRVCSNSCPSNYLILCCPLLLLPSVFPSIRVFSNESALWIKWPKYWSFSFTSVLPMNTQDWSPLEWTGWISLESKGLSSLLQHHSSKALLLWSSAFFIVQLSHSYMTTGKKHSFD